MKTLELLEHISQERAALAHCYPLPSPLDCIRYALTEVGEYEDAILAMERTGDKRNNPDRERDARKELGQVGEMLGAGLVQLDGWRDLDGYDLDEPHTVPSRLQTLATLIGLAADAMAGLHSGHAILHRVAWPFPEWIGLVKWHGWDAHALLQERYAQVREKHCQEAQS